VRLPYSFRISGRIAKRAGPFRFRWKVRFSMAFGQGGRVVRRHKLAPVRPWRKTSATSANVGRHHGDSASHRLDQGDRRSFVERRQDGHNPDPSRFTGRSRRQPKKMSCDRPGPVCAHPNAPEASISPPPHETETVRPSAPFERADVPRPRKSCVALTGTMRPTIAN